MTGARLGLVLLAAALAAGPLTGCEPFRERACSDGAYPVWSLEFPETGGACVTDGEEPPRGYATYPPGLVPEYEDEIIDCPNGDCQNGPLAITCPGTFPTEPCTIAGQELPLPPRGRNAAPEQ